MDIRLQQHTITVIQILIQILRTKGCHQSLASISTCHSIKVHSHSTEEHIQKSHTTFHIILCTLEMTFENHPNGDKEIQELNCLLMHIILTVPTVRLDNVHNTNRKESIQHRRRNHREEIATHFHTSTTHHSSLFHSPSTFCCCCHHMFCYCLPPFHQRLIC